LLWGKFNFKAPDSTLFLGGLMGFGGLNDLKKAEMDKTLRNWLIMSEMDPLNFRDLVGTNFAPVSNKTAVKGRYTGYKHPILLSEIGRCCGYQYILSYVNKNRYFLTFFILKVHN
jgi:hypothetical protein